MAAQQQAAGAACMGRLATPPPHLPSPPPSPLAWHLGFVSRITSPSPPTTHTHMLIFKAFFEHPPACGSLRDAAAHHAPTNRPPADRPPHHTERRNAMRRAPAASLPPRRGPRRGSPIRSWLWPVVHLVGTFCFSLSATSFSNTAPPGSIHMVALSSLSSTSHNIGTNDPASLPPFPPPSLLLSTFFCLSALVGPPSLSPFCAGAP